MANIKKILISIFIFVPLADITLQQLCETWVFHKDNWQTTEMPDEVNAITQIKACLEKKKCQKVLPCLSQYLDWDQEISSYLLSFIHVWQTDDGKLNMKRTLK